MLATSWHSLSWLGAGVGPSHWQPAGELAGPGDPVPKVWTAWSWCVLLHRRACRIKMVCPKLVAKVPAKAEALPVRLTHPLDFGAE